MSTKRREFCSAMAASSVLLLVQGCGGGGGDAIEPEERTVAPVARRSRSTMATRL